MVLENNDGIKTFDKGKLDRIFRDKIIEAEEKMHKEALGDPITEKRSNEQKEKENRKMMEKIITKLIRGKTKPLVDKEPDVYEAYQLLLSENYKMTKKQSAKQIKSSFKKKRMSISAPTLEVPSSIPLEGNEKPSNTKTGKLL